MLWGKFKMKTMKDHYKLYIKCYVLLLVFENSRNNY